MQLHHISPTKPEEEAHKIDTFAKILVLLDSLEETTDVGKPSSVLFQGNTSESGEDEALSGHEAASTPPKFTSGQVIAAGPIIKSVLIFRWCLKFSGCRNGLSVQAFLQRVEELCEARGVTKSEVWRSAVDLFEGKVLIWYRAVKNSFVDWDSFVDGIRAEFEAFDYDEKLL